MVPTVLYTALILGLAGAQDFATVDGDYEFVYHDTHNLLLVIHNNNCYFTTLKDGQEGFLFVLKDFVQVFMKSVIEKNDTNDLRVSNLDVTRDMFSDLLANYRCIGHNIYLVELGLITDTAPGETSGSSGTSGTGGSSVTDPLDWLLGPSGTEGTVDTSYRTCHRPEDKRKRQSGHHHHYFCVEQSDD